MRVITGILLGCFLMAVPGAFAQQTPAIGQSTLQPVDAGNKHCPVSGREIGVMGPAYKFEYKGKIYNLCCGGCPRTFMSNPAKYAKIAEDESEGKIAK